MKKELIDKESCIFYSTIFIAFSIGIHLQSVINTLVDGILIYITIGVVLLILAIYKNHSEREKKK